MDDEFAKIDWLSTHLGPALPSLSRVLVGIGDDAAVVDFEGKPVVVTVDTQVEGVHFRRSTITPADLGVRALIAAASDVWAMGATPTTAVVAITLPEEFEDADFRSLIDGVREGSNLIGSSVVGGNLSRAAQLTITTTVLGATAAPAIRRDGASAGDRIYVTGTLGGAALGLQLIERDADLESFGEFVRRWRRPPTHRGFESLLRTAATAAIDVSDGCLQDLGHVCRASGTGATIRADALPLAPKFEEACRALDLDPRSVALNGGEDYEILFTAPAEVEPLEGSTWIGDVTSEPRVVVEDGRGREIEPGAAGYRHFS
ncbi:MAG: thiamine-phosphate kinase [Myxococcota bacterium]